MQDLTYEEAEQMLADKLHAFPVVEKFVTDSKLDESIKTILIIEHLSEELAPLVLFEVKLILCFCSPLYLLPKKLSVVANISENISQRIKVMVESLIPDDIKNELLAFELHWAKEFGDTGNVPEADKNMKEKLELRPQMGGGQTTGAGEGQGEGVVRPLTREEVIRSIAPSRTMAKDIRTATEKGALNEQKETPKEMFGYSPHEDEDGVESERG